MSFTAEGLQPWPVVPDWSEPVEEVLAWRTDVLQPSRSAAGQHRALRSLPRRALTWRAVAHGQARRLCDLLLATRAGSEWLIPIWPDVQQLQAPAAEGALSIACRTDGFDFQDGSQGLLYRGPTDWAIVDVLTVGPTALVLVDELLSDWPAGTMLFPLRRGRIGGAPEQAAITSQLGVRSELEAQLVEACDWPAAMPTAATYRSWPVLEWRPEETEPPAAADARSLAVVDNDTATAPFFQDLVERALRSQRATWLLHSRDQQAAWRSLLYALAGRANPVWLPSWQDDLQLVADVTSVATTLQVAWCAYTLYGLNQPGWRDVRIELVNGAAFCRRITGASATGEVETLTIDAALGQNLFVWQVRQISFLRLCTLASDTVSIEHVTDADGTARCTLPWQETAE